jgi:hypothetical protein
MSSGNLDVFKKAVSNKVGGANEGTEEFDPLCIGRKANGRTGIKGKELTEKRL